MSPHYALAYLVHAGPAIGFAVLGAAFLALAGAEAMYADMGHFGCLPIRLGWFVVVLPALLLNYFGQGGLLLLDPDAVENPASRSLRSGNLWSDAFSSCRQATFGMVSASQRISRLRAT